MTQDSPAPLRVLLLGPLREQFGCDTAVMAFPADGAQASFWEKLAEQFPTPMPKGIRLARENEFLDATTLLQPGDEIALIPPVSGG